MRSAVEATVRPAEKTTTAHPAMRPRPQIPDECEDHRDEHWRREGTRQIETVLDAERFIEGNYIQTLTRLATYRNLPTSHTTTDDSTSGHPLNRTPYLGE